MALPYSLSYFLIPAPSSQDAPIFDAYHELTVLTLFALGKLILKNEKSAFLLCAFYGFNPIAMQMLVFVRMYMLLALFTTMLVYCAALVLQGGCKYPALPFIGLWLATELGLFTHFYFLSVSFFVFGSSVFILLRQKRFKEFVYFAFSGIVALAVAVAFTPDFIKRIFFVGRGGEAVSNITNFDGYLINLFKLIERTVKITFGSIAVVEISIIILGVLLYARRKEKAKSYDKSEICQRELVIWLSIISVLYILLTAKISTLSDPRYIFCMMPTLLLPIFCGFEWAAGKLCGGNNKYVLLGVMIVFFCFNSHFSRISNCFPAADAEAQAAKKYADYPVLQVASEKWRTCQSYNFLMEYDGVLTVLDGDFSCLNIAETKEKLENGFILYCDNKLNFYNIEDELMGLFTLDSKNIEYIGQNSYETIYFVPGQK